MPSMLNSTYYTKRILAARDPVTFTEELVKYTGFLTNRVSYINQLFRDAILDLHRIHTSEQSDAKVLKFHKRGTSPVQARVQN